MLTQDDQGWFSLLIVVDIDDDVDPEENVATGQGILFIPKICIIVGFINIVKSPLESLQEPGESVFVQTMLKFLQKYLGILGLRGVRVEPVIQELTVSGHYANQIQFLARDDQLEGVCVAKGDSVKVLDLFFAGRVQPVHEQLAVLIRNDEN